MTPDYIDPTLGLILAAIAWITLWRMVRADRRRP